MYSDAEAWAESDGCHFFLFEIISGVLQGCPLSGFLFNICIDPLLWTFSTTIVKMHLGITLACADDLATALRRLETLKGIYNMFKRYEKISGLSLQPSKCILILTPVCASHHNIALVSAWLHENIPEWSNMKITNSGKYLGMYVGPHAGKSNWTEPLEKYKNRIHGLNIAGQSAISCIHKYNSTVLPVSQIGNR